MSNFLGEKSRATHHIEYYESISGQKAENFDRRTKISVIESHCSYVGQAIQDCFLKTGNLTKYLTDDEANFYMKYGASRRLGMINRSYRKLREIACPARTEPLSNDESSDLEIAINSIYVNVIGVLDNLAWCLKHETGSEKTKQCSKFDTSLFSKVFRKDENLSRLTAKISNYKLWAEDVKDKRHPATHHIPLYVPPSRVTPKEAEKLDLHWASWSTALGELDFKKTDSIMKQIQSSGTFWPVFAHHPRSEIYSLLPTVSEDLGALANITHEVTEFVDQNAYNPRQSHRP